MANPTIVNDQITDSVTQANVKVLSDAPAIAMGSLYQTAVHALGLAMQNAVITQQNNAITLQAATTMGASNIYKQTATDAPQAAANLAIAKAGLAAQMDTGHISQQVKEAVELTLKNVLGSAGDVSYGIRCVMDSFVVSMEQVSRNQYRSALDIIKIAAISSTLTDMINKPEDAASYQQILEIIERM